MGGRSRRVLAFRAPPPHPATIRHTAPQAWLPQLACGAFFGAGGASNRPAGATRPRPGATPAHAPRPTVSSSPVCHGHKVPSHESEPKKKSVALVLCIFAGRRSGWQAWAAEHGRQALPAAPAGVAKVHQVSGLGDPTADGLCKDVLRRIGREGRGDAG